MIYVLGKTGLLGRYIFDYLLKHGHPVKGMTRDELNLLNLEAVRVFIDKLEVGDWVINCAGIINKVAEPETVFYLVNSIVPHIFDRGCHAKGAFYINPSTDCVFDPLDTTKTVMSATDTYGLSKGIAESLVHSMVIRCSILGEEERGFLSYLEWVRSNKEKTVNGYANHTWNGITCLEYAKFIEKTIRTKAVWKGVVTLRSTYKGAFEVDKYELTKAISDIYGLGLTVNRFETPQPNYKALRGNLVETDLYDQIVEQSRYIFGVPGKK
jgi:dTDP-4-dehydrorhamnose reductase